jgi:hypothetical protein
MGKGKRFDIHPAVSCSPFATQGMEREARLQTTAIIKSPSIGGAQQANVPSTTMTTTAVEGRKIRILKSDDQGVNITC